MNGNDNKKLDGMIRVVGAQIRTMAPGVVSRLKRISGLLLNLSRN